MDQTYLRFHGMVPLVAALVVTAVATAATRPQQETMTSQCAGLAEELHQATSSLHEIEKTLEELTHLETTSWPKLWTNQQDDGKFGDAVQAFLQEEAGRLKHIQKVTRKHRDELQQKESGCGRMKVTAPGLGLQQ